VKIITDGFATDAPALSPSPEAASGPPLRFERRRADRWPVTGVAAAYGAAGDLFGRRYVLRMLDSSDDGLGARTDFPIDPGTIVSVAFAAPGQPMRSGIVVRCLPCGDGYRVAIRFEARLAA